jgi:hypothetical protein
MIGPVAAMVPVGEFPFENVLLARDRYSYEGNWLFCTFDQDDIRAARVGCGLGRFHWEDYGLDAHPDSSAPISYRLEVITPAGVHACLYTDQRKGTAVRSDSTSIDIQFRDNTSELFNLHGWPEMSWRFRSPEASIAAELQLSLKKMAVWPDCVMPNNTFSMCIGVGTVSGDVFLGGKRIEVVGGGVYDHPRVVVDSHNVPLFGWYLYSPLRFPDGSFIVSYYAEDGLGKKDEHYSTGFLSLPDGTCRWLNSAQIRRLDFGKDDLPVGWDAQLSGEGVTISYRTRIVDLALVRSSDLSDLDSQSGKYLAFPLLMETEGECKIDSVTRVLERGSGIAEFLVRKGYQPAFP